MLPGRDLRNHAAVQLVQVDLGGNDIRTDLPPVVHHCRGRLITGAFDCQYIHIPDFFHIPTYSNFIVTDILSFPAFAAGKIFRTSSMYTSALVMDGL